VLQLLQDLTTSISCNFNAFSHLYFEFSLVYQRILIIKPHLYQANSIQKGQKLYLYPFPLMHEFLIPGPASSTLKHNHFSLTDFIKQVVFSLPTSFKNPLLVYSKTFTSQDFLIDQYFIYLNSINQDCLKHLVTLSLIILFIYDHPYR